MTGRRGKLRFAHFVVASGLLLGSASLLAAQTAGQDLHQAGSNTSNAAKDTGRSVKTGTAKGYSKTKQGATGAAHKTKEGTTKGYDKTKEGVTKGYDKTKEGTKHVLGLKGQNSTTAKDKVKETNQKVHDTATQESQKASDAAPRY